MRFFTALGRRPNPCCRCTASIRECSGRVITLDFRRLEVKKLAYISSFLLIINFSTYVVDSHESPVSARVLGGSERKPGETRSKFID